MRVEPKGTPLKPVNVSMNPVFPFLSVNGLIFLMSVSVFTMFSFFRIIKSLCFSFELLTVYFRERIRSIVCCSAFIFLLQTCKSCQFLVILPVFRCKSLLSWNQETLQLCQNVYLEIKHHYTLQTHKLFLTYAYIYWVGFTWSFMLTFMYVHLKKKTERTNAITKLPISWD